MNLKTLGLLALAVTALMAFTANAYATTVTSPTGTTVTGEKKGVSVGHIVLHNPIATIECASTMDGPIESHGAGVTAIGKVSTLTFTGCTNSWHVTAITGGEVIAHAIGGYAATVTLNGSTLESTRFGAICRYKSENTDFGEATGGNPTTVHVNAAVPFHSGSPLCGTKPTLMTGLYEGNGSAYYDA